MRNQTFLLLFATAVMLSPDRHLVAQNFGSNYGSTMPQSTQAYEAAAEGLRQAPAEQYDFSQALLGDVLRFLATDAAIPFISLPQDSPEASKLTTFSIKASPFSVLETICQANGLSLIYENNIWYFRPADDRELLGKSYTILNNSLERVAKVSNNSGLGVAGGAGGGAGGFARKKITAATIGASQSVTAGGGGTAGSTSAGGTGGTSSFGAIVSATGGAGGFERGFCFGHVGCILAALRLTDGMVFRVHRLAAFDDPRHRGLGEGKDVEHGVDGESRRQVGAGGRVDLHDLPAHVHADPRLAHDRALSLPLRPSDHRHSRSCRLWPRHQRVPHAAVPEGCRLQHRHHWQQSCCYCFLDESKVDDNHHECHPYIPKFFRHQ